jgi:hypothetical protein
MGLNHDPNDWKMLQGTEKRLRVKIWWTILIHDRWFNFAYGTPPYIVTGHYDVPLPNITLLTDKRRGSIPHTRAAECYIALCQLTELVGDLLPLLYHIRSGNESMATKQIPKHEADLNLWLENLPKWFRFLEFDSRPCVLGLVNLQMSYLAFKMLLCRIAWHEVCQMDPDPPDLWLLACKESAENVTRFLLSLQPSDLKGFWLPYNNQHFASAVTLLLRCALQTNSLEMRRHCMASARDLVDFLRRSKSEHNWDLAQTSLIQCEPHLERVERAFRSPEDPHTANIPSDDESSASGNAQFNAQYPPEMLSTNHNSDVHQSIEELFPEIFSEFTDTAILT